MKTSSSVSVSFFTSCVLMILFCMSAAAAQTVVTHTSGVADSASTPPIDLQSGLIEANGKNLVLAHCSACHSTALITQNAMSRERWLDTIRWMQETQKLWPLGDAEPLILDYLSMWYGPKTVSRRQPIAPHLMPDA